MTNEKASKLNSQASAGASSVSPWALESHFLGRRFFPRWEYQRFGGGLTCIAYREQSA